MDTITYLYIIIAAIAALAIAVFQYFYRRKSRTKIQIILTFLRFISVFSLFLLLINPSIESLQLEIVKPKLIFAIDNSSSIKLTQNDEVVKGIKNSITNTKELTDKFDVDLFSFDNEIQQLDTLDFLTNKTNIITTLSTLDNLYKDPATLVLVTDGNQTLGSDYSFYTSKLKTIPVVVGDTVPHQDLKITNLNVNRYSFLNNTFPVELFVNYNGDGEITENLIVKEGNTTVFRKTINLNKNSNSEKITLNLTASKIGLLNYNVRITSLDNEINTINNSANFSVEVINEQSKIALVSDIIHPDLGMLKRAIETNKQRSVTIVNPQDAINVKEYQLLILYQPNNSFAKIFEQLNEFSINYFVITGPQTDWGYLNTAQNDYQKNTINQSEEYQATVNTSYSSFLINDFDFQALPPLTATFGTLDFKLNNEVLLFQNINGIETNKPLLATFSKENRRGAILQGEGIWKWRTFSYAADKSFYDVDQFMNKLIQYLSIKKRLNRLDIDYLPLVYQNDVVTVKATYFDSNYSLDTRAELELLLRNKTTNEVKTFPFRLSNQLYISNISDLQSGEYSFTVSVKGQNIKRNGTFTVLDYNIEQQFTYANMPSLKKLANTANSKLYHTSSFDVLLNTLKEDNTYKPIQKSSIKKQSLIDWRWLLGLIVTSLALEWFIRKYNGLI